MIKILTVLGARPQVIKSAAITRVVQSEFADQLQEVVLNTGQHYDKNMSKVFFEELEMPEPDIYLGVGSGSHAEQTAKIMIDFEKVYMGSF